MNIELVEVEIMLDQIIKNCLDQMQEFVNGTFIGVLLVKNIMYTK